MTNLFIDCFATETGYCHEISEIIREHKSVNEDVWKNDESNYQISPSPCAWVIYRGEK